LAKVTGASFSQSTLSGHATSQYKPRRYKRIVDDLAGAVSVYGVLDDGRLTYATVDAASGERTGVQVSSASLGLSVKAMATLNFNTILVTSSTGELYRVDVTTNRDSLAFNPPVHLADGWVHDRLAYDGKGHLFGIANGVLHRYTINATKPAAGNIVGHTVIGTGYALKTLTAIGPNWILGTTDDGHLISYRVNGPADRDRFELKSSTWNAFSNLVSPGGGVYFAQRPDGALYRYVDGNPYDGRGTDISNKGPVDTAGWTQQLLSAQPGTVA
jgi:hypothetical protein